MSSVKKEKDFIEAYRRIYSALFVVPGMDDNQSLMVVSSIPGEGKTTSSIYIAAAAAEEGKTTLLIDLDLRKYSTTRYLGINPEYDVQSILKGGATLENAVISYAPGGFDVLAASGELLRYNKGVKNNKRQAGKGQELMQIALLTPRSVNDLIEEAKRQYDVVIIDVPPIMAVQDALMVGRKADAVVSVVDTSGIARKAAARAASKWREAGITIAGLIVRGTDSDLHDYYGYNSYHYGYGNDGVDDRPRRLSIRATKKVKSKPSSATRRVAARRE